MSDEPFAIPFRCLVSSSSGAGKTYLLINKLLKKEFRGKFHYIWSIIPTIHQPCWQEVDLPKDQTFEDATNETFEKIYEKIKEIHKKNPEYKHLIILDDCAYTELLKPHGSSLSREILRLRHYNVSIIMLTQLYKCVPPSIRVNITDFITFRSDNQAEIKKMSDEIANFDKTYEQYTSEKYHYLFVNNRKNILDESRYLDTPF
jgi:hypothetical protein